MNDLYFKALKPKHKSNFNYTLSSNKIICLFLNNSTARDQAAPYVLNIIKNKNKKYYVLRYFKNNGHHLTSVQQSEQPKIKQKVLIII